MPSVRRAVSCYWHDGRSSPPSNRLDDLYLVARLEDMLGVLGAGDELFVDFDGDSALFEHELRHEHADGGAIHHFLNLTVDDDLHDQLP